MSQADWNTTDRVMYGLMVTAFIIGTISMLIEACRTRPKVQMMVLGVKPPEKPGPDESSSAAVEQ